MTTVAEQPGAPPDSAAAQHTLQLAFGFIVSAALGSAARFGVADQLSEGPRTTAELARSTGANEDALHRVLRALAMVGVFTETSPRTFALTPAANMLRSGVPGSVRDMVLWMCDTFHFRVYAEATHAVQTGDTLDQKVLGMPAFEYLKRDRALSETFNNAMTTFSATMVPAVLEAYDFSGIDVLVDVAGGHGMILGSILRRYPQMRGVLFDLDHVIAGATALEELQVRDRCQTVSGDVLSGGARRRRRLSHEAHHPRLE